MTQKQYPSIPSPNFNDRKNEVPYVCMVLIEYTAASFKSTANTFANPLSQASAHYVIDTDGQIYSCVAEEKRAWHAGYAYFDGIGHNLKTKAKIYGDINSASIGIQVVNPGYDKTQLDVVKYTKEQIQSLRVLVSDIVKRYNLSPKFVLGSSDVSPGRKFAPGFYFPWNELTDIDTNKPLAAVLTDEMIEIQDPSFLSTEERVKLAFKMYGYSVHNGLERTKSAFQERYNPFAWYNNKPFGDEDKKRLLALLALRLV